MRRFFVVCLIATTTTLTGCQLYFGGGDDECVAVDYDVAPAELLRDPQTGDCSGYGSYPCDERCGPCPQTGAAHPDWGSCYSACEDLTEFSCIATDGCRAAYWEAKPNADQGSLFRGCWAIAPSGPERGGDCTGLDAYACSRHDDCAAYYDTVQALDPAIPKQFTRCTAEKLVGDLCYGDQDCAPDERCTAGHEECLGCPMGENCPGVCQGHCVPKSSCANADCGPGYHCEEQCENGSCGPVCVPDVSACAMIDCGPGYECVEVCTSDPNNPGWGVCHAECKPINACETLTTESACTMRPDCVPVYLGEDCTCYPTGCDCNILTYDHCETK
jgi:hypothetical protein